MNAWGTQSQPDALQALHDVVVPGPISWMPQTAGWYVVMVLLLAGLTLLTVRILRRRQANRYRGAALKELAGIRRRAGQPSSRTSALLELPALVKRTALSFRGRNEVAGLTGDDWLEFLDGTYGGHAFSRGPGRLLADLPYRDQTYIETLGEAEVEALFDLVDRWISRHSAHRARSPAASSLPSGSPAPSPAGGD